MKDQNETQDLEVTMPLEVAQASLAYCVERAGGVQS